MDQLHYSFKILMEDFRFEHICQIDYKIIFYQVKCSDGGYIDVPYMADAVLVNLGALMQNWTSDKYLATVHYTFYFTTYVPLL